MRAPASRVLALILLSMSAPSAALAQTTVGADLVGDLVRVTSVEGRQFVGTATALTDGSLQMTATGRSRRTSTFAVAEIRTLERRVGGDSDVGQGALWGAGLGLVAGGIFGGVLVDGICSSQDCNEVGMVAALGGVGALGGALIGTLFGALSSTTLWEVVPLDSLSSSIDLRIEAERGLTLSGRVTIARSPRS